MLDKIGIYRSWENTCVNSHQRHRMESAGATVTTTIVAFVLILDHGTGFVERDSSSSDVNNKFEPRLLPLTVTRAELEGASASLERMISCDIFVTLVLQLRSMKLNPTVRTPDNGVAYGHVYGQRACGRLSRLRYASVVMLAESGGKLAVHLRQHQSLRNMEHNLYLEFAQGTSAMLVRQQCENKTLWPASLWRDAAFELPSKL